MLIRTDANAQLGSGHLMRCLALAQAWQGAVTFAVADTLPPALDSRLQGYRVQHLHVTAGSPEDAVETAVLARYAHTNWVVVDGYQFDTAYLNDLQSTGLKVLVIDDYAHLENYPATVVLNQNIGATEALYPNTTARLLLGTRYALLRQEFGTQPKRDAPLVARRLLVTFGGSDPQNATANVLEALRLLTDFEIKVIIGPTNLHRVHAAPHIELLHHVSDMPRWMAWADMAISASGSTCWELAFMGVPMVLVVLAENQWAIATGLDAAGVAVNLGWQDGLSADMMTATLRQLQNDLMTRRAMIERGQVLVDGMGAARVVNTLREMG